MTATPGAMPGEQFPIMSAGKWLSVDRGAIESESQPVQIETPPSHFPLADRITDGELQALFLFRTSLPVAN
jgi:hypothetical protein